MKMTVKGILKEWDRMPQEFQVQGDSLRTALDDEPSFENIP